MPHKLTPDAVALLEVLRTGDNFSQPTPSYGSFAYSAHAEVFFSNAIALCNEDGMSDFRVYGALYSLRHGIELMLKCISRNDRIDEMLRVLMRPNLRFADACGQLKLDKKPKAALMRAVCIARNVLEDRIHHPKCQQINIGESFADHALEYFRQNPTTPRDRFTLVWPFATRGHDLVELWEEASPVIDSFVSDARRHAIEIGYPPPLTIAELKPIIDLLAAMDDGGDGFRYPSSISGEWYMEAPQLSLSSLRTLAESVKSTCKVFESVREECYSLATLRNPSPQYDGDS